MPEDFKCGFCGNLFNTFNFCFNCYKCSDCCDCYSNVIVRDEYGYDYDDLDEDC